MDATLIVIPARDEADSIGSVIRAIAAEGAFPVLVINDGSTDSTAAIAAAAGAMVLTLPVPLGAWGAMQTGIRFGCCQGFDRVVTMDADGQHEPRYLLPLIDLLKNGDADVAIGACPERGSLARKLAWSYFRRLAGFSIEDLTSGFRVYNRRAMELLSGPEATLLDYQDIGVLLLLRRAQLKVTEMSVEMRPRQAGHSRIYSSWWAVARYMLETTVLCLAHWNVKPAAYDD
jgi:glycosyltransferase involved in cell wall biosynthesis